MINQNHTSLTSFFEKIKESEVHIPQDLLEVIYSLTSDNQHISYKTEKNIDLYLLNKEQTQKASTLWKYLETQTQDISLTSRWDWVETWLTIYQDVVDYTFIVGLQGHMPCGIALVTKETHRPLPIPIKAFHIGTGGEPFKDAVQVVNNTLLAKNEIKKEFSLGVINTVMKLYDWEEIVFDEFSQSDATTINSALKEYKVKYFTKKQPCQYLDLDGIRKKKNTVLCNLSHDTRYSVRRSLKAFNNDLTVEWAENTTQAHDILDELVDLYEDMWAKRGVRSMFQSLRFARFQKEIINKMFSQGNIILFRVKSKQYGTLGCLYLFIHNGEAYGYQLGFGDFTNVEFTNINKKRLRIGFIVHTLCMEECLKRGIKAYNFSVGDYDYKRALTNKETEVVTISIQKNIKPKLRDLIIYLYKKYELGKIASVGIKFIQSIADFKIRKRSLLNKAGNSM